MYYESLAPEEPKFCYRLLHLGLRTRVLPALAASAQRKPGPTRQNAASDNIVIHVRNACKDFNAGLDSVLITQVRRFSTATLHPCCVLRI